MSDKKSDSSIEKGAQELDTVALADQRTLDISLALPGVAGVHEDDDLDPAESSRVRNKLDRRILPLLFLLYTRMSPPSPMPPPPLIITSQSNSWIKTPLAFLPSSVSSQTTTSPMSSSTTSPPSFI